MFLPLVRDGGADVEQSGRALERASLVVRLGVRHAEQRQHTVAEELVEHAAGVEDLVPHLRVERRQRVSHDRVLPVSRT